MTRFAPALAALALVAAAAAAAAPVAAQDARIRFNDLDLSTAAGAATFDARVEEAAAKFCRNARRPVSRILDREGCAAAVRNEAVASLPDSSRAAYAAGRRSISL